jgi:cold shock CspA family protein
MRTGQTTGTVRHWSGQDGGGTIDAHDVAGGCSVEASVVRGGPLRAGQTVRLDWETDDGVSYRVTRVVPDDELGSAPGA